MIVFVLVIVLNHRFSSFSKAPSSQAPFAKVHSVKAPSLLTGSLNDVELISHAS